MLLIACIVCTLVMSHGENISGPPRSALSLCLGWLGVHTEAHVVCIGCSALLCEAVYHRDFDMLQRLLQAKADANAGDYDKRTALHIAAAEGDLEAVSIGSIVQAIAAVQPKHCSSMPSMHYRSIHPHIMHPSSMPCITHKHVRC